MQDDPSSTFDAVEGPQSDCPGKLLFKLAESLHRFGDARAVGKLTSEKLLEIAEAARSFQTPQSGHALQVDRQEISRQPRGGGRTRSILGGYPHYILIVLVSYILRYERKSIRRRLERQPRYG